MKLFVVKETTSVALPPPQRLRRACHSVFRDDFNGAFNPAGWDYEVSMYGGYVRTCLKNIFLEWSKCAKRENNKTWEKIFVSFLKRKLSDNYKVVSKLKYCCRTYQAIEPLEP